MQKTSKIKNIALITGASSGLGLEFAKAHAQAGGNMVLVARREERLQMLQHTLETQYKVRVWVLVQDLAQPDAAEAVVAAVQDWGLQIDILINNAGVGGYGFFCERDLVHEQRNLQLNIGCLTALTHHFLPGMVQRGTGCILNVASVAGLFPGPWQAVYYASKAYVVSFSQALAQELEGTGVSVTTLCPGPVATEFVQASGWHGGRAFDKPAAAAAVARLGYHAMQRGRLLVFDNRKLRFLLDWVLPLLPRRTVLRFSHYLMRKRFEFDVEGE